MVGGTDAHPVGVVGGGLGGLAAACTLAARGHRVVLFDKNPWLGGKAAVLEAEGFRFDMGPTILTVPRVLRRIFAEAGRSLEERLELIRLDPQWRCFFDDGSVLDLVEEVDAMADRIDGFAPGSGGGEGYRDFMRLSKRLHEISERFFFWKPVEDLADTIDMKRNLSLSTLRDVLALRMGATVAGTIRKRVSDGRVAQMLDHFVQYVGSSPYGAPAVLCSIAQMQVGEGVWYPRGGTRAVPAALADLAAELGVELRTGVDVTRIVQMGGRVTGVETASGDVFDIAAVFSKL
jgi:phytoene desaturase